ncbi:MAG: hypothetical protein ACFE8N_00210 [Promethearchaeota archaeon]
MKFDKKYVYIILVIVTVFTVNFSIFQHNKYNNVSLKDKNIRMNVQDITIVTPENKTYTEPMSGYYPATYGFETDASGIDPEGWILTENNGYIDVTTAEGGHKQVLKIHDESSGSGNNAEQVFEEDRSIDGDTIEWWWSISDSNKIMDFRVYDSAVHTNIVLQVFQDNGYFHYWDGAWHDGRACSSNVWYHCKIVFDFTNSQYDWYIDGIIEQADLPFAGGTNIRTIRVFSSTPETNYDWYLDAIGYSWDPNYNIGDNLNEGLLLSYTNSSPLDWVAYSLDGQPNKTIMGSTVLSMPDNGIHPMQVFGKDSLGINYESAVRYFSVEQISIDIISPVNTLYSEPMSGYYPATYGFENDAIGSDPEEWTVYEVGGTINVISALGNHNNVVEVHSTSADHARLTNLFPATTTGTIECWVRTNIIIDDSIVLRVTDGASNNELLMSVNPFTSKWEYNDGDTWYGMPASVVSNTWFHLRIEFDCTDDWHLWIDGVSQDGGTGFGYRNPVTQMDRFIIGTTNQPNNCYAYFDAIGYSWDPNYSICDNLNEGLLLSYTNSSPLDWIAYSLDGQPNKTIMGNTVLPMPDNGIHTIQISGRSTLGYYYLSDLVIFTVDIPEEPTIPGNDNNFIIIIIMIGAFSLLGVVVAVVVYKKVHLPSAIIKLQKPKPEKKRKTKKTPIREEELFCPFCNTSITFGQKFCTYCGSNLVDQGKNQQAI